MEAWWPGLTTQLHQDLKRPRYKLLRNISPVILLGCLLPLPLGLILAGEGVREIWTREGKPFRVRSESQQPSEWFAYQQNIKLKGSSEDVKTSQIN